MIDLIIELMLYISALSALIGAIGMLRFPDFYTRVHGATMINIGGVCLALLAFMISTFWSVYAVKALIVILIILLTNPTGTHAIADAAYKTGRKPKALAKNDLKKMEEGK